MIRIFLVAIFSLIVQGCTYATYTTKLSPPIERTPNTQDDYFSSIDGNIGDTLSASVGDELFVMNRFITPDSREIINFIAPTGEFFPQYATWTGTHVYNDGTSANLIVYTTPEYYNGIIGVILDENENVATNFPLVQVSGKKPGRRWRLDGSGKFFTIPSKNIDSWALRYGGNNNNQYIFEIVTKHESQTSEVLQTIYIGEKEFRKGFIIRDVFIQGINVGEYGVIEYKIEDVLVKNK